MRVFILKRKTLTIIFIICCSICVTSFWIFTKTKSVPTVTQPQGSIRDIHLVTGEFKGQTIEEKEIEAYRWDPGTILIEKGEKVKLKILGVNGREHPFIIEGTNVKGTVKQGVETIVPLQFDKEGVFRLICQTHPDKEHNGPMIAYIIVD